MKMVPVVLVIAFALVGWVSVDWMPPKTKGFPEPLQSWRANKQTMQWVRLGRYLFFDPLLSADSTISCASCHSPLNAFAHSDHTLSHGIGDSQLTRNAPGLFNLAWQPHFMWDGAVNRLYAQPLVPIENKKEMGSSLQQVLHKLNASGFYLKELQKISRKSTWDTDALLKALESFQLTLISVNSKYDQVVRGNRHVKFSEQEAHGYQLFKANCNSCHAEPLFTNYSFQTNKLPQSELLDAGRFAITRNFRDSMLFKVPSLRNLSYTLPYMHDGRFRTLSQVLKHYSTSGVLNNPNRSLNEKDQRDIIAFLLTLNDESFIRNKAFHFPMDRLAD